MEGGKWWEWMVTPGPGGTTRGRPREEVECIRRVSLLVAVSGMFQDNPRLQNTVRT